MMRSKGREKLFKWVGHIAPEPIVLFALKSSNIKIKSIADLNKYKIGVVTNDISHLYLMEKEIPKENIKKF